MERFALQLKKQRKRHEKGEKVVLVRHETSPEDIEGMVASEGILTTVRGGLLTRCCCLEEWEHAALQDVET